MVAPPQPVPASFCLRPTVAQMPAEEWDFSNVATGPPIEMPDFSKNKYTVVS